MTAYVFGAGASRHAGYPLASELLIALRTWLQQRIANSSGSSPPEDDLRSLLTDLDAIQQHYQGLSDVEEILTHLADPNGSTLPLSRGRAKVLSAVQWTLRDFFTLIASTRHTVLYERLVRQRLRPGDTVVTFNYDLAVERALRAARLWDIRDGYGFSIERAPDGQSETLVRLLKLHGSVNWAGPLFGGIGGFGKVSSAYGRRPLIPFMPDYEYLGYDRVLDFLAPMNSASYELALIVPVKDKIFHIETPFGQEWLSFWDGLFEQAGFALEQASRIVVVGYSLPEADGRARDLLLRRSNKSASVVVICGSDSERIASEFRSNGFRDVRSEKPTFENWLATEQE